ncbi:NADPH-dependent 7-cyano-7-deazaguanine reductase QueF [Zwartia sp.]|uniref:NADPH-dependent 7-cyano-7-deazaguanine reductase QueF n=1 Tax=Zwartia sp. TaxID=2978004 RepID=UPI00271D41A4|nr:NADPH-dependent 7-cyano-7-deazaguanine reductase QueF [Zwartia sp.]MDO9026173.1 NADPH-dependent 7-cyano-7-deazaguanine reductase QueF [Zwartia sp.]
MKLPERDLPLGQEVAYPTAYDAGLLYPIGRVDARAQLGLSTQALPFIGWDLWNAYEMSWLTPQGMPRIAMLRLMVDCNSPNIIESKSLKLYLNSFNQAAFISPLTVIETLRTDLSQVAGSSVSVELISTDHFSDIGIQEFEGIDLDKQTLSIDTYEPKAELLELARGSAMTSASASNVVTESLFSRLLKSNCPVTGQPDWACLKIDYVGPKIDHASLLRYIVSFRQHSGFHEQCVERIFTDIMARCAPKKLSVYARYTRRGGLDINPWRATPGMTAPGFQRSARQ